MPNPLDQITQEFESRRPLLLLAAHSVAEDLREALKDAGIPASVAIDVPSTADFMASLDASTELELLSAIPTQILGRIAVSTTAAISRVKELVPGIYTPTSDGWFDQEGHEFPAFGLTCLLPPQALPDGWNRRADMPDAFTLIVVNDASFSLVGALDDQDDDHPVDELAPVALVMKGGGIKGLAYVGAVRELSQHYEFKWFVGTSAGAITALFLAAGYDVNELEEILRSKDFSDFFDAPWYAQPYNLLFRGGLHPAKAFTDWMDGLLAEKLAKPTRVKLSDLPHRVTIYASKRDKGALVFDSETADADAAYAARCSMSIPLVFEPQAEQGIQTYDGGLQHNYPIDQLLKDNPKADFVSLFLGSETYEPPRRRWGVLSDVLAIWTGGRDADALSKYRDRTVIIDPRPIGTLDFALTDDEKSFLLSAGRAAAIKHLRPGTADEQSSVRDRETLKSVVDGIQRKRRRWKRARRALFLLIAMGAAAWWFWPVTVDPRVPVLLRSSGSTVDGVDPLSLDRSIPGIAVKKRHVAIDMSKRVYVRPDLRDVERMSPSVHTYTVNATRLDDEHTIMMFEFASQRALMEVAMLSEHPYALWFREDPGPLGKGFRNVWTLVVDVTQHSKGIPFTLKYQVTRYNAYQAEDFNYVGHLVFADEELIETEVVLPNGYLSEELQNPKRKRQGVEEAQWTKLHCDGCVTTNSNNRSLRWLLPKPESGWAYKLDIDWRKAAPRSTASDS